MEETTEKKKGSWTKFRDEATYKAPSGTETKFDFSKLSNEVFAFYGKKQWIADNGASAKTEADRIDAMKAAYAEAVEKGVELSEEGKVKVIGKTRANAAPKTQDALILPKLSTFTKDEVKALKGAIKLGLIKVSEGLQKQINELK